MKKYCCRLTLFIFLYTYCAKVVATLPTSVTIPNDLIFADFFPYCCDNGESARFVGQWSLYNQGQAIPLFEKNVSGSGSFLINNDYLEYARYRADMKAPEAWAIRTDASSVIIAVIDSGVNYLHPDLTSNLWVNEAELHGKPEIDDDGNGVIDDIYGASVENGGQLITGDPMDTGGHGTSIAGIIGAVGNNSYGITSICWKARIMAVRCEHFSPEEIAVAIRYAIQNGARIINMSLGTWYESAEERSAFEEAERAGVIIVLSAENGGNDTDDPSYRRFPASWKFPNCIVVTATTPEDKLWRGASFGASGVDIAAPGRLIVTLGFSPEMPYQYETGTSFAAPHVAGAAALVWSEWPNLSNEEVLSHLKKTADRVPKINGLTASGRLNLYRALSEYP